MNDEFYELIQKNKEILYRIAYCYFKNEIDSLEAIQETTFRAYKNIKRLKDVKNIRAWLIRIMINYCINETRKKKRVVQLKYNNEPCDDINYEKILLQITVDKLPPKYKQIIILKYFEDLKIKDIAQILGKPEGTIKTLLNKALNMLRTNLSKEGVHIEQSGRVTSKYEREL